MSSQTNLSHRIHGTLIKSFLLIIIVTLLYFTTSYLLVQNNKVLLEEAIIKQFNTSIFISKLAIDGQKLRRYEKEYFIYIDNKSKRLKYLSEWSEAKGNIQTRLEAALMEKGYVWDKSDRTILKSWLKSLSDYSDGFKNVTKQVSDAEITNTIDANIAVHDAKNAFRFFLKGTSTLGEKKFLDARKSSLKIEKNFNFINIAMLITSVIGFLILLIAFLKISNAINNDSTN